MTDFDFTNAPDRRTSDSIKWDVEPGQLPMWIADMDFKTAPVIVKAMKKKIDLEAFGYEWPSKDYFDAVKKWYKEEHNAEIKNDWMIFSTGVIPALSSIVRRVSHIGDNVVVQEPVYNIFYNSIENNGRHVLSNDLIAKTDRYEINWPDLEAKLADPLTTMMIFCNPHNPIGQVWTKDEVQQIADLCHKHHVTLVSDEIHGDLVRYGEDYTPAFSVKGHAKDSVISLVSPSKTFNVAALHAATVIVPDKNLRHIVERGLNSDEVAEPNLLAIPGTIAAYTQGHEWLQALKVQLNENFNYAIDMISEKLPNLKVVSGPATYLMWINISNLTTDSEEFTTFLKEKTGLIVSSGALYRGNGHNFIRINLACPLAMVKDGLKRLQKGVALYSKNN